MHELYIAQCIIESVGKSLPEGIEPDAVTQIRVRVGQLDAVIPETLLFLFDAIKSESGFGGAQLLIEQESVRCRCRACSHEFEMELPVFVCPDCNATDVELLQGRGILLTGITASVPEERTDGNPDHS